MTLGLLVRRNIARHPVRSSLTFAFAALAIFLVVFLRSVVLTFERFVGAASPDRIVVQSAVATFGELPASYYDAVAATQGVESVCRFSWFGGVFRDPRNFFARLAVDMEVLFQQYPEIVLSDREKEDALADRRSCLVGRELADEYGFRVGDTVPLQGTLYPRDDGRAWEFTVRGIFRSTSPAIHEKILFLRWEPFEEGRRALRGGDRLAARVTFFGVKVRRGADATRVMAAIDARYEGGPVRTHTQTESQFRSAFLSMLGSVPTFLSWIGGSVVFAILLGVANAAGIAAREGARECGVLAALGCPGRTAARLLIAETASGVGAGGLVGLGAAHATVPAFRGAFGMQLPNYFILPETTFFALLLALAIGVLGALVPARRLSRLRPVDVLRAGE